MDYRKISLEELEQLAAKKDGQALCELGRRYQFGEGGAEQNYTLAYRMYHKAEKLNIKDAFLALGQMYENGEYFAKSVQIAEDYYKKALGSQGNNYDQTIHGTSGNENTTIEQTFTRKPKQNVSEINNVSTQNSQDAVSIKEEIQRLLKQAECERKGGNTSQARLDVEDALDKLNQHRSVLLSVAKELEADINWLFAYIAFNEQKYADFERYIFRNGVLEYYPWGNYLLALVHKMMNADYQTLFQDMQNMLNILNNPRLQESELGDVLGMLGDLCLEGIISGGVEPIQQAYEFYNNAADMGNIYAEEQRNKFHPDQFGEMIYSE